MDVVFEVDGGSDVAAAFADLRSGERSSGIRILRSSASSDRLALLVEGRAGQTYDLALRTAKQPVAADRMALAPDGPGTYRLTVSFTGSGAGYVRRDLVIQLR